MCFKNWDNAKVINLCGMRVWTQVMREIKVARKKWAMISICELYTVPAAAAESVATREIRRLTCD